MAESVVIENVSVGSGFKIAAGGFLFGLCIAIPLVLVGAAYVRSRPEPEV